MKKGRSAYLDAAIYLLVLAAMPLPVCVVCFMITLGGPITMWGWALAFALSSVVPYYLGNWVEDSEYVSKPVAVILAILPLVYGLGICILGKILLLPML